MAASLRWHPCCRMHDTCLHACPASQAMKTLDAWQQSHVHPFRVMQAQVQWMQKHARVLTTPAAADLGSAAASLPDQTEALHAAERPEQDSRYWRVLHRLAAVGWAEDAVGLLGQHSAWQLAYSGARNQQMLSLVRAAAFAALRAPSGETQGSSQIKSIICPLGPSQR